MLHIEFSEMVSEFKLKNVIIQVCVEVIILFFPRHIDRCRQLERPRPISQWTLWGKL